MKIDLSEYKINHCGYCTEKMETCDECIKSNEYYSVPTKFNSNDKVVNMYVKLLEDVSRLLYKIGFKVT